MRTFEFVEGTSNKFWNIELKGKTVTTTYGKVGSAGQSKPKDFGDEAAAKKEHDKLVAEKLKKGYKETTKAAAAPVAAAAAPAKEKKTSKAKKAEPKAEAPPAPAAAPAKPSKAKKSKGESGGAAAAAPAANKPRTFEFVEGTSNKFWNVELKGKTVTTTYGKIGSAGQSKPKDFGDEAAAKKEYDKLVAEKLKKGYKETTK